MSNREIKFRAWDIQAKKYLYPKLWDNTMPSNWEQHYILEQYTGLKDRNGVEIYEGDVLEYISSNLFSLGEKIRLSVSYVQARFWCYGVNNGSNIGIYLAELIDTEKCKVIGNINQNPELL